jgi:hypothetical protein
MLEVVQLDALAVDMIRRAPQPAPLSQAKISRKARMLLILVAATVVSGAAGLLSHAAGKNVPDAVLTAGGAFAGAVGVLLALVHYAGPE